MTSIPVLKVNTAYIAKLGWYWNRLRLMSVAEIGYRFSTSLKKRAHKIGFFTARSVSAPDFSAFIKQEHKKVNIHDESLYIRMADKIASGQFDIFALKNAELGVLPEWNRDPKTGKRAPLSFGLTLDYRDASIIGDIKYLWEPNRHLHLVTLAQAYYLSGNKCYLDVIARQLNSWFDQCPYLMGPNWSSSLESGIRLINWSFVWRMCGGLDSPMFAGGGGKIFLERWLTSIYQHAHFVRNNFSRFSSANNHVIGEAAGLFVATVTWPFWRKFEEWHGQSYEMLVHEALLQNYSDGVNREQAISYQQFVLDFLLISMLTARDHDIEFPVSFQERIEQMLEYVASIMDFRGNVPMIGDADDGYVVRLSQEAGFNPYRSLLASGAVLFSRGDFKAKAQEFDDKSMWLLGEEGRVKFDGLSTESARLPVRQEFSDGGYYILGSNFESGREIRLIADTGPLGYQSIAAHGHADALAITLSVAGHEILIDPGTYAYHTKKEWRDYFRGTSAHNTIVIDGENQSVIGGNFMWLKKAKAQCLLWETGDDYDRFTGQHDGYSRLADPVIHRREIVLHKTGRKIVIKDMFTCRDKHIIERFWHFSEHCDVTLNERIIEAKNDNIFVKMVSPDKDTFISRHHGELSPPRGWVSREFDVKVPTSTVVERVRIFGDSTLTMEIICY